MSTEVSVGSLNDVSLVREAAYPTFWSIDRIRQVLGTESRQKARDLFLQVHRPFHQIRVDFCKDVSTGGFVDEAELRNIVQSGRLDADNRLFFIVGEAGSGKSELCQWLEYTTDPKLQLSVHIPRSMTSAAHVASLLRKRLAEHLPSTALRHTPIPAQARYVASSAVVLLYESGPPHLIATAGIAKWEKLLSGRSMAEHLEMYLRSTLAEYSASAMVLDVRYFAAICKAHHIDIAPEQLPLVATDLQQLVSKALDRTVWLGDLRKLLTSLSEQAVATARRPLLLIEDITAFQLFGDLLLDYLLDLTSGHFDAVVGVTTGFERTQLAKATLEGDLTHIHHRLRARFVLTDTTGRSYGLEEDLSQFARSYLDAVRQQAADLDQIDLLFGTGLYPFTEIALQRAFGALHEDGNPRQTPRLFIEHVLGATLLADVLPPLALDRSPYLMTPPTHFRLDEVPDERLQSLLRWYGQLEDDAVTLDSRIPSLWGIPVPSSIIQEGQIRVSRTYVSPGRDLVPIRADWQQELRELQTWLSVGGLYPSRETLKQGIERILLEVGDPRSLANPYSLSVSKSEIYYARGDERLPIFLDGGSGDQPSGPAYLKVRITHEPEARTVLEELAYLALSGLEPTQVCQNLTMTLVWAQQHWDKYHTDVQALLQDRLGGIAADELVFIAWHLLSYLVGNVQDLPTTTLQTSMIASYASITPWSPTVHRVAYTAGEALLTRQESLRRLFIGMFTLRESFVDSERYYALAGSAKANELLAKVAKIEPNAVRSLPYKIRPGNQYLHEIIVPLQRYARALCDLDVPRVLGADVDDLGRRTRHLEAQMSLDLDLLHKQLGDLRQMCGEVGVTWSDSWNTQMDTLASLSPHDLPDLLCVARSDYDLACGQVTEGGMDVWDYQRFRHKLRPILSHPYWNAVSTLADIRSSLVSTARSRYRRDGRLLVGTQAYRDLLGTVGSLRKEMRDAN
jgi:hypothetical protein